MALPEGLPKLTLGFQHLNWGSKNLAFYTGDNIGDPWVYTNEQARFILWFYALDEFGRYLYRRGVLERPKGAGKSPFLGALAATELLGPVKFSHWIDPKRPSVVFKTYHEGCVPVGKPHGDTLIQIAAVNESQVDNSYTPLMEMLARGPAEKRYNLDIMASKIVASRNRQIKRVTASPSGIEGAPTRFVVMDETWLWTPAQYGPKLAGAILGNCSKIGGRSVESTNAYRPGDGSVAELTHLAVEAGNAGRVLYDSRRGTCEDIYDHDQFIEAAEYVYGDAKWVDLEIVFEDIRDPLNSESENRRKFLNELTYGDTKWFTGKEVASFTKTAKLKKKKEAFALGFRGAVRNGSAALVACRLSDQALFLVKLWEKPDDADKTWEVDYLSVDETARAWLGALHPKCLLVADSTNYPDIVGKWGVDYEDSVEGYLCSQKLKFGRAVNGFEEAAKSGRLSINSPDLARHINNCHLEDVSSTNPGQEERLVILRKDATRSSFYIQAAQAAVLAFEAARLSIENGALEERADNETYFF